MAGYVSDAVIRRLPGYYRHLKELEREGVMQISSQGLGDRMHLTASQIRQDINCFGGFGRQGYGYSVPELREHIARILGVDQPHQMIIIGSGNIGRAVACSDSFPANGFETTAIFDRDPDKIGMQVDAMIVQDIANVKRFINEHPADIAVLAIPAEEAQAMADTLYALGIKGFWNFAPCDLKLEADAAVVNVHLDEGLQVLSFRMLHQQA
ncbi:MAG: redox-sensing transcriptional repressor Rex [Clostridiales bacterium]|nr:redox-sensing transcriptional repressor Rex [Clostridiales bacterium]